MILIKEQEADIVIDRIRHKTEDIDNWGTVNATVTIGGLRTDFFEYERGGRLDRSSSSAWVLGANHDMASLIFTAFTDSWKEIRWKIYDVIDLYLPSVQAAQIVSEELEKSGLLLLGKTPGNGYRWQLLDNNDGHHHRTLGNFDSLQDVMTWYHEEYVSDRADFRRDREKIGWSRYKLAVLFNRSVEEIRNWEEGVSEIPEENRRLMRLLSRIKEIWTGDEDHP